MNVSRLVPALVLTAIAIIPPCMAQGDAKQGDAKEGEKLFAGNCSMCHPHGGNVLAPKKELKGEEFLKRFPNDSQIQSTVRKGIPNSVMSPFAKDRLSDKQVADIIAYVRTLTPKPKASPDKDKNSKKPSNKGKALSPNSKNSGTETKGASTRAHP